MKGWKKLFCANGKQRRTDLLAILLSNKIGFKSKSVIGDKGHYIVIKVRVNSPNIKVAKYMHLPSDSQIYEANIHR